MWKSTAYNSSSHIDWITDALFIYLYVYIYLFIYIHSWGAKYALYNSL